MIKDMYKIKIISLLIRLFGIIKTKALECVSVVNQKCIPRSKILDVNEGVGEALFYPYNVLVKNVAEVVIHSIILWQNCAFLMLFRE